MVAHTVYCHAVKVAHSVVAPSRLRAQFIGNPSSCAIMNLIFLCLGQCFHQACKSPTGAFPEPHHLSHFLLLLILSFILRPQAIITIGGCAYSFIATDGCAHSFIAANGCAHSFIASNGCAHSFIAPDGCANSLIAADGHAYHIITLSFHRGQWARSAFQFAFHGRRGALHFALHFVADRLLSNYL